MSTISAALTLFLIMDPLGNIPVFLSALDRVAPERRRAVLLRELCIALVVMLGFLFAGPTMIALLGLDPPAISLAGGIVLFLIALRMIFPTPGGAFGGAPDGEPLVVPLAIPLVAGPSVLATLLLLRRDHPEDTVPLLAALVGAWFATSVVLNLAPTLYRRLGARGLVAVERLMGMVLVAVAVQMIIGGVRAALG